MRASLARRRVLVAVILVLVAIVATESVVLAATVIRQGTVQYMKAATENVAAFTTSTAWVDVPGTALAMPVPSGEHDFFQITFSVGHVECVRNAPEASGNSCDVRALVDGQEISPGPVQFGNNSANQQTFTHSMQWVSNVLAPGTHYVKMQFSILNNNNTMMLGKRTMTVVRVRAY